MPDALDAADAPEESVRFVLGVEYERDVSVPCGEWPAAEGSVSSSANASAETKPAAKPKAKPKTVKASKAKTKSKASSKK